MTWYAAVWWDADATGRRILDILHNGGPTILARDEPAASGWNAVNGPALSASTSWTFAAGDYVEAQLFQTSGGPLNHAPFTAFAPVLAVKWTGP